jgi:3-oxoacyl-[acyl-carrier-protein] synthase II
MRRVVITGLGAVTPLGVGVTPTWEAALAGKSGIGPIPRFDLTDFSSRIAAEVKGFDAEKFIDRKEIRRMDPFLHYTMAAAHMAMEDSGLVIGPELAPRAGVYMGSGLGGLSTLERYHKAYLVEGGPKRISPFFIPMLISNLAPGNIAMKYGAKGPNILTSTACAASSHAVGEAMHAIRGGVCDVVIAGGAEATVTPLGVGGFCAMKALSTRNDDPAAASRPFDKDRDGFVVGEGSAILVLEELEFARKRGAKVYAEILGYGASADAHHITAPAPGGEGAARAMAAAIADGGSAPGRSTTSTRTGPPRRAERPVRDDGIKAVFGDRAKSIPVSSTKSMTGHLLGASGAIEAMFCALTIRDGVLPPPTINYTTPDPSATSTTCPT